MKDGREKERGWEAGIVEDRTEKRMRQGKRGEKETREDMVTKYGLEVHTKKRWEAEIVEDRIEKRVGKRKRMWLGEEREEDKL